MAECGGGWQWACAAAARALAPQVGRPRVRPARVASEQGWSHDIVVLSPDGGEVRNGAGAPLTWRPDDRLLLVRRPDFRYRLAVHY